MSDVRELVRAIESTHEGQRYTRPVTILTILACLLPCSPAAGAPIPLEAYGRGPWAGAVAVAPDGDQIAWVRGLPGSRELVAAPSDALDEVRVLLAAPDLSFGSILWLDDQNVVCQRQDGTLVVVGADGTRKTPPSGAPHIAGPGESWFVRGDGQVIRWDPASGGTEIVGDVGDAQQALVSVEDGRSTLAGSLRTHMAIYRRQGAHSPYPTAIAIRALRPAGWREVTYARLAAGDPQTKVASVRTWEGWVLLFDGRQTDRIALVGVDLETGESTVLFEPALGAVTGVLQDPRTGRPLAVFVDSDRLRVHALDPAIAVDIALLDTRFAQWRPTNTSDDMGLWVVHGESENGVAGMYLYDRHAGTVTAVGEPLGSAEPWRPMESAVIPARDGLPLVVYATRPDPERFGPGPWPAVLQVHGGPTCCRDEYGWDAGVQRLADLGYAVMSVEFRGSGGFGRSFVDAAASEWGRAMLTDRDRSATAGGSEMRTG